MRDGITPDMHDYPPGYNASGQIYEDPYVKIIEGLKDLLQDAKYLSLRERYDKGQLSFYGQIKEIEIHAVGEVLTK